MRNRPGAGLGPAQASPDRQAQRATDGAEGRDRTCQILCRVRGRDLAADARLSALNHRIAEADHEDALFEERLGEAHREAGIAEDDRDDRMLARQDGEAGRAQSGA